MAKKLYEEKTVQSIADAIRAKNGSSAKYTVAQMSTAISKLEIGGAAQSVEWHQCPELPRNFVNEVTYDPADYSVSSIGDYAPATAVVSNYKPIGKTVGGKTFYNEVPNAKTPFVTDSAYGTVQPLDHVRYINTPKAPNVRDLGGWKCDGGTVKYGLLFRGGEPTVNDRSVLVDELGIRHDLNLRGAEEATWDASPLGNDVYFTKTAEYNWYSLANTEAWKTNLRCVFGAVTHNEPVLFHCAAGADRTGTLACVLEGLLGMSQSDIDKDYELTCFYSGSGTDAQARRRNEAEWKGLISQINAKDGTTFRDKCVTFAAELGFTGDEINAYRAAMIEGTPEEVTPDIGQASVSCNIEEGITTDNQADVVTRYQAYTANIKAENGIVIQSVKVVMGGKDITATAWDGEETNLERKVTLHLTNCTATNAMRRVIDGQGYVTSITADSGYQLDGAEIKITMGGQDMGKYYSGGVIAIPNVTGDIEITIAAAGEEAEPENQMVVQSGNLNKRISGNGNVSDGTGCFVCDPIAVDLTKSCPVTFKGFAGNMGTLGTSNYENSKVVLLNAGQSALATWYISRKTATNQWETTISGDNIVGDLSTILTSNPIVGTMPAAEEVAYVRFAPQISESSISASDLEGLEIIMPEV